MAERVEVEVVYRNGAEAYKGEDGESKRHATDTLPRCEVEVAEYGGERSREVGHLEMIPAAAQDNGGTRLDGLTHTCLR